jgi:YjbE family integral membrane protein
VDLFSPAALFALFQVFMINIVMSGDNAVVIGMTAARVSPENRRKVIFGGLALAVVLRVLLSLVAVQLLNVLGLTLAGGIILLWIAWRLYRDVREAKEEEAGVEAVTTAADLEDTPADYVPARGAVVPLKRAILQVMVADLSMSVDNVLAVAAAAREHILVMASGLILSIAFMGIAAAVIARLLQRYHWLNYAGIVLILYVALQMIWSGSFEVVDSLT